MASKIATDFGNKILEIQASFKGVVAFVLGGGEKCLDL